jgi:hypothetical protein
MKKKATARAPQKTAAKAPEAVERARVDEQNRKRDVSEWVIPALFLILPFAILLPGLIWKSHRLFFILFALVIVAISIRNLWVKSFLIYSVLWQTYLYLKAFASPNVSTGDGLAVIIAFLAGAIVFKFVSEGKLSNENFYSVIRIAALLQIAVAIPQCFGFNPVSWALSTVVQTKEITPDHLTGTIGNRDFFAAFVAVSLPMFIGWKNIKLKVAWPAWLKRSSDRNIEINPWLILIAIILFLAPSPATLAAILGVAIYYNKGWKYIGVAILLAIGYGVYYVVGKGVHLSGFIALPQQLGQFFSEGQITVDPDRHDLGRFAMWMVALGKLLTSFSSFLFGFGPGATFGRKYPLHNEYMSMWFEFGLVGLTLLVGYIATTVKAMARSKNRVLFTSFAIACLDMTGNYPIQIAPTAFLILIVVGLIERERMSASTAG